MTTASHCGTRAGRWACCIGKKADLPWPSSLFSLGGHRTWWTHSGDGPEKRGLRRPSHSLCGLHGPLWALCCQRGSEIRTALCMGRDGVAGRRGAVTWQDTAEVVPRQPRVFWAQNKYPSLPLRKQQFPSSSRLQVSVELKALHLPNQVSYQLVEMLGQDSWPGWKQSRSPCILPLCVCFTVSSQKTGRLARTGAGPRCLSTRSADSWGWRGDVQMGPCSPSSASPMRSFHLPSN